MTNDICRSASGPLLRGLELMREGCLAEAEALLTGALVSADPPLSAEQRFQCLLLNAGLRLARGDRVAGRAALRHALAVGREAGLSDCVLCQAPDLLATLCAEALEAGIETDYVERLIQRALLPPPSPAVPRWPYPLRIHTLGRPAIVVHGRPMVFSGKGQRRPLELLHCLIALGGREVSVARLVDALWPEARGVASRSAFDMALTRLRRLIGVADALPMRAGRLSLNDGLCWIDLRTLERLLGDAVAETDPGCALALMERALGAYQGGFLPGEAAGWAVLARERLTSRLLRAIERVGQGLERAGRWREAARLYERGRECLPLEEDLCRRLLRSHIEQGELAQAVHLYDRCRELFAKVLGVMPSASTVSLINPLPRKDRG
ncbi:MAG: hypothetical protein MUC79_08850 [Thiobacillaceae bacterium]|nr:hypothetical protein [Thiobacillaceae bacterium]